MEALAAVNYTLNPAIDPSIFRAYDIRGIVGAGLDESAAYSIGRAVGASLQDRQSTELLIGYDGRLSSPALVRALQAGAMGSGIDVTNIGMVPSPMLYFACYYLGVPSGLMVTGSHNPKQYNGIKLVIAGKTLTQTDIQELYQRITSQNLVVGQGSLSASSVANAYISTIASDISLKRPLKVVVDAGNAVAGEVAPRLLRAIGCEVVELFCEVDGNFPNHHPDPSVEANLACLKQRVLAEQADIGLAFDGDGDRLGVVTNRSETILPDRQLMLYAKDVLKRNIGATIVYDVKCSANLKQVIEEAGGNALMCPTGHSIVKATMKKEQALLAGEMSGHLFFKERWYGFDDALYSACRLLEILSGSEKNSSQLFASIPDSVNTPEITMPMADGDKFDFITRFCEVAEFQHAERITIDGLRVEFVDGWGLLRASNTTPCLVARFEADNKPALARIQAAFKTQLLRLAPSLDVPF